MKNDEAGMTLIEVIAVIVLVSLLAVVVGKGVFKTKSAAMQRTNELAMDELMKNLALYKSMYNSYPAKLVDLIKPSPDIVSSGAAFAPLIDESALKDVYKADFVYTQENNGRSFTLKSFGEDGLEGGEGVNMDLVKRP